MTGLIFHIRSFSVHDGPGIRQTVFLKGCPLRCSWCHNPESQESDQEVMISEKRIGNKLFTKSEPVGKIMTAKEVMDHIEKDILFYEESGGGVTLSGGEPLMQPGFTAALLEACKTKGIHTALDTCGFAEAEVIQKVLPFTDIFLYDLKIADEKQHEIYTGVSNRPILDNLKLISQSGKSVIIRIPLVPGTTDNPQNLYQLRSIIEATKGVCRIDILPFHTGGIQKYQRLGKTNSLTAKMMYDMSKALEIRDFFKDSAPVVSIGG
jgi:pyruvate formate lyase activating enzyme